MFIINQIRVLSCVCILLTTSFLNAEIVTLAALDVGSAETKMTIADVDTESHKIVQIHCQITKNVELRKDLAASHDGNLSQLIHSKLLDALKEMKAETSEYSPKKWFGIGTSVFRTAKDGQDLLDRIKLELDIPILLVSQEEEAEIGFLTAIAASKMNPEDVNVWDSGAGSFQISTMNDDRMDMYGAEYAFVSSLEALFEIRKQTYSMDAMPGPVNLEEAVQLAAIISENLPSAPKWVTENKKPTIVIGGKTSVFNIGSIATGHTVYTRDQIWESIIGLCSKSDDQFKIYPQPEKAMVALILLYAVMEHCSIDSVSYFRTNGTCEGILIIPRYWSLD